MNSTGIPGRNQEYLWRRIAKDLTGNVKSFCKRKVKGRGGKRKMRDSVVPLGTKLWKYASSAWFFCLSFH